MNVLGTFITPSIFGNRLTPVAPDNELADILVIAICAVIGSALANSICV